MALLSGCGEPGEIHGAYGFLAGSQRRICSHVSRICHLKGKSSGFSVMARRAACNDASNPWCPVRGDSVLVPLGAAASVDHWLGGGVRGESAVEATLAGGRAPAGLP